MTSNPVFGAQTNQRTLSVVFAYGANDGGPWKVGDQREFARMMLEYPLPAVYGHREASPPDRPTSCPGEWGMHMVRNQTWVDAWGTVGPGARTDLVRSLKVALRDLGYRRFVGRVRPNTYDERTVRQVRRFQRDRGLLPDGRVGPATYRALCNRETS